MNTLEKIPRAATNTSQQILKTVCVNRKTQHKQACTINTFLLLIDQSTKGPKGLASPNICPSLKHTATRTYKPTYAYKHSLGHGSHLGPVMGLVLVLIKYVCFVVKFVSLVINVCLLL